MPVKINWKYVGPGIAVVVLLIVGIVLAVTLTSKGSKDDETKTRSVRSSASDISELILQNKPIAPAVPMEQIQVAEPSLLVQQPSKKVHVEKPRTPLPKNDAVVEDEPEVQEEPEKEEDPKLQPIVMTEREEAELKQAIAAVQEQRKSVSRQNTLRKNQLKPKSEEVKPEDSQPREERQQDQSNRRESLVQLPVDILPAVETNQPSHSLVRSTQRSLFASVIGIANKNTLPKFPADVSVFCMVKGQTKDVDAAWLVTWISALSKVAMLQDKAQKDEGCMVINEDVKSAHDLDYELVTEMITDPDWDLIEFIFPECPAFSMIILRGSRPQHLLNHFKQVYITHTKTVGPNAVLPEPSAILSEYYKEHAAHWLKLNYDVS